MWDIWAIVKGCKAPHAGFARKKEREMEKEYAHKLIVVNFFRFLLKMNSRFFQLTASR